MKLYKGGPEITLNTIMFFIEFSLLMNCKGNIMNNFKRLAVVQYFQLDQKMKAINAIKTQFYKHY